MGKVSVRLFARLADIAGLREIEVETGEGLRAMDILPILESQHPGLGEAGRTARFAVNREFVSGDHTLSDGDEVALIPPVSGGSFDL